MAKRIPILGVQIDNVTRSEALDQVMDWLKGSGKHYVVTPNIEFLMYAQKDPEFKAVLNKADLAIADSARLNWAAWELKQKNFLKRLIFWPFFLMPKLPVFQDLNVVTGTDLMTDIITSCNEKAFIIGFLGGRDGVAEDLAESLKKKYPRLKIGLATSDVEVNKSGEVINGADILARLELSIDILFVAFGQVKQEMWIANNLHKTPVKVMIGVGGAFDYLSGKVPRAPVLMRKTGFEWLFRLIIQPWRIRRFSALVKFVFLILLN